MSFTNADYVAGVVIARNGADETAHETITYDLLIMFPNNLVGEVANVKPVRRFEPGMKIHPANVGEPFDGVILEGELKFRVTEGVKFAACAPPAPSGGGVFSRMLDKLFDRAPAAAPAPDPSTGGAEE